MNDLKYRSILYVIVLVILATIGIQSYWNYKNYLINKQQLINDVQVSLDNAVDVYYANLAEKNTIGFAIDASSREEFFVKGGKFDSIFGKVNFSDKHFEKFKNIENDTINGVKILQGSCLDSLLEGFHIQHNSTLNDINVQSDSWIKKEINDSIIIDNLEMLTSKVVISMTNDTVSLKTIDTILKKELIRKKIFVSYGLSFIVNKVVKEEVNKDFITRSGLKTLSKSPFLPRRSELSIHFTDESKVVLKRIFVGILISTLLVLAVIACLLYLLKIIKHQKQLSEVKNDLISNITHEFKTPISTISVALESIKDFNEVTHNERTNRYLNMSTNQLSKLNMMVEKLLETATLDSNSLVLNKERVSVTDLLKTIVEKFQALRLKKELKLMYSAEEIFMNVDVFHFENAINNIIDNAVKYGGNSIVVELNIVMKGIVINVVDNGVSLEKQHKEKLFEQFYRVPKGNVHDVKGFGIGLYYAKKIIEKHDGTIQLELHKTHTIFKISLPNE